MFSRTWSIDHIRASAEPPAPAWKVIPLNAPDDATKFPSVQRTIFPELRLVSRTGFAVAPENPVPTPGGGGSGVSTIALSVRLHSNSGAPHCCRNGAARAVVTNEVTNKKKHIGVMNRTTIWVSNHRAESQPSRGCCEAPSTFAGIGASECPIRAITTTLWTNQERAPSYSTRQRG